MSRVSLSTEDRKRSLQQAATGGALFGAGAGGSELLNRRLKAKGAKGPYRAIAASAQRRTGGWTPKVHGPHLAGKLGSRGLQAVGLPLAAVGLVNAVRAKPKKTRPLDIEHDVVRPVIHHATMADQLDAGEEALRRQQQAKNLAKALSPDEQRRLARHRKIGRATALTGGTLGLGALAARTPGGAKLLAHKVPALARVAEHEPAATRLSNTLGVTAIGTGSAGSFNYAAQQKLERKREPMAMAKAANLARVTKRDDAFLRGYKERISPSAESGYRTLKHGRNRQAASAAGAGALAGLSAWQFPHEVRSAGRLRAPGPLIAAATAVGSGLAAHQNAAGAYRYHQKMNKIKAKARSRRAQGLYGPGRGKAPVDTTSAQARKHQEA